MNIVNTTYFTNMPILNFARGWAMTLAAIFLFMCLLNSSLGYQIPVNETVLSLLSCVCLSWREKIVVKEGGIRRSFVNQICPLLSISLSDIHYYPSASLTVVKADFGYYSWQVETGSGSYTVLYTGKSELFGLNLEKGS